MQDKKLPPTPRQPRMKSAVRVRRNNNSHFADFMARHFPSTDRHPRVSPAPFDNALAQDSGQRAGPLKRPRLGTSEGEGRRGSTRSISAVENLAAQDRSDYLESTSGQSKTSRSKTSGNRATDGHAPQLSRVTEDEDGPDTSLDTPAFYDADEATGEGSSADSATSHNQFLPGSSRQNQAGVSPKRRAFSTSPFSASGATRTESKSNDILTSEDASSRSGETRFLTPPRARKSSLSASVEGDAGSRDNRLRRPRSNVSIPTPVEEEGSQMEDYDDDHHTDDVADYLDVVDPEVGALGYLSNIGNSIFLPNIPALYDRRPTHNLPASRRRNMSISTVASQRRSSLASSLSRRSHDSNRASEEGRAGSPEAAFKAMPTPKRPSVMTRMSSAVGWNRKEDDEEFVKHIKNWRDMDEEERDELDEHVKMLLTKKSKFKRGAKGFYAFTKTPMGFIMTLYGFLVTFWGTAIVLFIFGWIHVGGRKRYWIEICDQILCALFAAVGLGFAPFRAVDTYRMIHIAHYHHLTWKRRQQLGLKELSDPNDLPRPEHDGSNQVSRMMTPIDDAGDVNVGSVTSSNHGLIGRSDTGLSTKSKKHRKHLLHHKKIVELPEEIHQITEHANSSARIAEDLGAEKKGANPPMLKRNESIQSELIKEREDVVVLTKGEQEVLEYHQRKFHASHTFYRYHATSTHHAFPLDLMIVITCLLDCHSLLQAALGGCTWGIKYTHRPTALTATLISCSLSCNAVAGLIIYLGGRRTKKREEVERRLRIALEAEALAKIERRRARGELPGRDHQTPNEKTQAEDQEAADKERDAIVRRLGHLEGSPSATKPADSSDMEMSTMKKTLEGSTLR